MLRLFTIMLLVFLAETAFAAGPSDHTNYWKFDEGYGRSVGDPGGQNGVMTGSSTGFGWASGKVGAALGFDGKDGESVALPNAMLSGGVGSISLWFKINSQTDRNILIGARSTTDNNVYALLGLDREGRPQFMWRDNASASDRKAQAGKALNVNEWYHLVFIANGQSYRMIVNGEEMTMYGNNIGRWFPETTNHTLGYAFGALTSSPITGVLDGYLDDIRIYNRALSFDEATALYDEGNYAVPTHPVATPPPAPPAPTVPVTEVVLEDPAPVTQSPSGAPSKGSALTEEEKAKIMTQISEILKLIIELQKQLLLLQSGKSL